MNYEELEKGIEEIEINGKEEECDAHTQTQFQLTCFSDLINDVSIHFQIIRFPTQINVWIGYSSAKLGHVYAATSTRLEKLVFVTSILGGNSDNTGSGIARRLVLKTGLNIVMACNIPNNSPVFEAEAEKILIHKLISLGYTKSRLEATSL